MNTTSGIAVLVALGWGLGGRAWAGQPNTNQAPQELRFELNLIDGSRMIGIPTIESVPIQTSYAKMAVPLKQILTIKIDTSSSDSPAPVARTRYSAVSFLMRRMGPRFPTVHPIGEKLRCMCWVLNSLLRPD